MAGLGILPTSPLLRQSTTWSPAKGGRSTPVAAIAAQLSLLSSPNRFPKAMSGNAIAASALGSVMSSRLARATCIVPNNNKTQLTTPQTGRILTYPKRPQVQVFGTEHLGRYQFGHNVNRFCKVCGVSVDMDIVGPPEQITTDWTGKKREFLDSALQMHPVNIRLLDGVEWKGQPGETAGEDVDGKMKPKRVDGRSLPPVAKG